MIYVGGVLDVVTLKQVVDCKKYFRPPETPFLKAFIDFIIIVREEGLIRICKGGVSVERHHRQKSITDAFSYYSGEKQKRATRMYPVDNSSILTVEKYKNVLSRINKNAALKKQLCLLKTKFSNFFNHSRDWKGN